MRYCNFNGCNSKVAKGLYCDDHKRSEKSKRRKQKQKSIYHHENKSFYNSDLWKAARAEVYEREKGLCQRCHTFVFGRRAHVHHIIPIAKDTSLKLEVNNLMLLCPQCHAIVENESDDKKKSVFPSFFKT